MESSNKIAIIGGGNLGGAVASGLIASGTPASQLHITRRSVDQLQNFKDKGAVVSSNNIEAVKGAKIVILAVKPYHAEDISKEIVPHLTEDQIFISLIAALPIKEIRETLNIPCHIFRVTPNTAISVGESITSIATDSPNKEYTDSVMTLFKSAGEVILIEEGLMIAATALGSCGTAFALRFIRALQVGGIETGFKSKDSLMVAAQMVKGAAEMILQSGNNPEIEIDKVTTPKGMTIAGLHEMEHNGLSSAVIKGVNASYKKGNS